VERSGDVGTVVVCAVISGGTIPNDGRKLLGRLLGMGDGVEAVEEPLNSPGLLCCHCASNAVSVPSMTALFSWACCAEVNLVISSVMAITGSSYSSIAV
jgi:hypothetical protein